ncbi:MAG: VOC family protein [Pseudomonadota bacterium]
MTIELDHFIVPSRDQIAAAKQLAQLLDVPWAETALGPFSPVFINDGLTLDFISTDQPFPVHHYCFRVGQHEFDAILARLKAAGISYRSTVRGPIDLQVSTQFGGNGVYWNEPDGHQWEMLTVSYARASP